MRGGASESGQNAAGGAEEAPGQPGPVIHVEEACHRRAYTQESAFRQAGRGVAAILLVLLTGAGMAMADEARGMHKGYEMPPYSVERADGAFEIRQYEPHLVAEVTVAGDRSTAINRGFRVLAGYIFGGNATGEKVAMTVPVTQSPRDGETWTVRFMMPSGWSAERLPKPQDDRIRFVTTEGERQAVVRFSGIPGTAVLERKAANLRAWIAENGLRIKAGPHFYFYDAPMTLPWTRRNEVAFTID